MFNFDEAKVPEVKHLKSWPLLDGTENHMYKAGDWSFETDDEDIEYAESAIYAWIAWKNYLESKK